MKTLTFEIVGQILQEFPNAVVGAVLVQGLDRAASCLNQTLTTQIELARESVLQQGLNLQNLVEDQRIAAWRDAFKRMGLKPSTYKSSVEQLIRRMLKNDNVKTPLEAVNLYCALSAKHVAPIGAYDITNLPDRRIALRYSHPETDRFTPLSGRQDDMQLSRDVVVYASGTEVMCWAFNYRDSRNTCLRRETESAVFFSEGTAPVHQAPATSALSELRHLLVANGAQVSSVYIVNGQDPYAAITL